MPFCEIVLKFFPYLNQCDAVSMCTDVPSGFLCIDKSKRDCLTFFHTRFHGNDLSHHQMAPPNVLFISIGLHRLALTCTSDTCSQCLMTENHDLWWHSWLTPTLPMSEVFEWKHWEKILIKISQNDPKRVQDVSFPINFSCLWDNQEERLFGCFQGDEMT